MTFAARIPTFASGDPYAGSLLAVDFTRNFYKAPGFVGSDFSRLPGLTVTRATPAVSYAQTSGGVLVPFAANVARIVDQGLLVEEARTNLALASQDIGDANWTKTDITVGAATTAPDGTATAKLATAGSAGTDTLASNNATITASQSVMMSILLKKSGTQWLRLVFADSTGTDGFNQWVDLTNGVLGTSTIRGAGTKTSATIATLANGFYRVVLVGVCSTRTSVGLSIVSAAADGSTTRVNGATYYPWQLDINAGVSFALSPVPTTSASVTRAADIPLLSGQTLAYPLTAYVEWTSTTTHALNRTMLGAGSGGPSLKLNNTPAMTGDIRAVAGLIVTANTYTEGAVAKGAVRFQSGSTGGSLNGGTVATSATTFTPTNPTTLGLGVDGLASNEWLNGYLRKALIYPRAFSDAELIAAST